MQNKDILKEAMHNRLGTTDEILEKWATHNYPVNKNIVNSFWNEIKNAKIVRIIGDYDADGICASYILMKAIHEVCPGKNIKVRIPRRFTEGYGMNKTIAEEIIANDPEGTLVITVDNGIVAKEPLEMLKTAGYKVIVTDHHHVDNKEQIPTVDMVIDPVVDFLENPFEGDYWCGAGIAYKLSEPYISDSLKSELMCYAGLATIADCMVLREGNWGLVKNAMKQFCEGKAPDALYRLLYLIKLDPNYTTEDYFGYYLGPIFNAPGRLLDAGAVEVLKYLHHPTKEAAEAIISLNTRRKELAEEQTNMAKAYIAEHHMENECPLWINIPGLHQGIAGIIAGNISKEYKRPAIVVTNTGNGILKGSARSYGSFDVFEYLCSMKDKFSSMGGHPGAAGLSIYEKEFENAKLHQVPLEEIGKLKEEGHIELHIHDYEIPILNEVLNHFRPFGVGNSVPDFDLEVDVDRMNGIICGKNKDTLSINKGRYKIMHFHHIPNELQNENHFGMIGNIADNAFKGEVLPQFTAREVYDLDLDER